MSFTLPKLSYAHDALEPNIDSKTMEIHHGKHHQGYTNNLNGAIEGTELEGKSIEDILATMDMSNSAVRNNGGGFYNHSLFWEVMSPEGGGLPTGELADAINESFGDFEKLLSSLHKSAITSINTVGFLSSPNKPKCVNVKLESIVIFSGSDFVT